MSALTIEKTTQISGYTIIGEIGQGAASKIYVAQDPADGQVYALKHVVRHGEADDRFIDQAVREAEIGQKLNHPNLRRVHKLIRKRQLLRTDEVVVLMEFIDGMTLRDSKPSRLRDLLQVFKAVARGLSAMHAAGFAHADVKPINILRSDGGAVKIIDYGQSCPLGTIKERVQGTPDYIAPEQVRLEPISVHTDMFNFGATMYWCVTGRPIPSRLKNRKAGEKMPTLEDRRLREPSFYRPDMPSALNSLICDCLRTDPKRRPRTMDDVRARLNMSIYQIDQAAGHAVGDPGESMH